MEAVVQVIELTAYPVKNVKLNFVKNVMTTKTSVIFVTGISIFKIIFASLSAVLGLDQKISFVKNA